MSPFLYAHDTKRLSLRNRYESRCMHQLVKASSIFVLKGIRHFVGFITPITCPVTNLVPI